MRIAVIGAGVLGSLYAARLAAAGQTVTLVARGGRLTQLQQGPILILNEETDARAAERLRWSQTCCLTPFMIWRW